LRLKDFLVLVSLTRVEKCSSGLMCVSLDKCLRRAKSYSGNRFTEHCIYRRIRRRFLFFIILYFILGVPKYRNRPSPGVVLSEESIQ